MSLNRCLLLLLDGGDGTGTYMNGSNKGLVPGGSSLADDTGNWWLNDSDGAIVNDWEEEISCVEGERLKCLRRRALQRGPDLGLGLGLGLRGISNLEN